MFRDPIERNISAFFDAFELYAGTKPEVYAGDLEHLEYLFHKHLPYTYPLKWFDDNFHNDTQIDVYKYSFNAEIGHTIIHQDGIEVLIMNCYLEDSLKEKLIGKFCEISKFKLVNTNITANRTSGELYRRFKEFIRFDKAYLEECYNSKYAKHFLTEIQRKLAIKKWLKD
nr:putative capsular polysaccharide synthesis family protein [Winogradskyella flava]